MAQRWKSNWKDFIVSMAVGSNSRSRQARMIKSVGGHTPDATRDLIGKELAADRIDDKTYAWRIECVDYMQQLFEQGVMGGAVVIDGSWDLLPSGGHMRKTFKDGSS